MPSQTHTVLVDLFRSAPSLALDLLSASGIDVPGAGLRVLDSTFPVTSPDYHVDLALVCEDDARSPSLVVLVEVQLDHDPDKHFSWPLYQAAARARFRCAAEVLVVTIDERVAEWARKPVTLGARGSVFHAIDAAGRQRGAAYLDLLRYHLGAALERALEELMATNERPFLSDWANGHYDRGRAVGARSALLTVITARGIPLGDDDRARIEACADVAALDTWLTRAVRAATSAEIFAD
jgi:hypothetical protein